ncbi:type II secretion system secretin GspD [Pseudomonas sp. GCM10022188]|uniref:type II secretion system secretin GspD n=1 Tax=Pseudomonas TaxID=286 RepID=UPI001E29544D|nr:type II secretion system secretin GspD [Pseudomonas oryzagri]MCC6075305.1 type II secretion system secretin GspD [Pseudomonas oryzagri]
MMMLRRFGGPLLFGAYLVLAACAAIPGGDRAVLDNPWGKKSEALGTTAPPRVAIEHEGPLRRDTASPVEAPVRGPRAEIYRGTGATVNLAGGSAAAAEAEGDITLNFQQTEIAEVVKVIMGEILGLNYVLDQNVTGTVSLQTSRPLTREALLPTLETLLEVNGAALIRSQNFYEIVPLEAAPSAGLVPRLDTKQMRGYQLLVVPLRYISAAELMKILEPLKPSKGLMTVDERRNLLMVAGSQEELNNIRETVQLFDVDQLRGMSVGLFRLQSVEAGVVLKELETIFGDASGGPLAGMMRFLPIERLNALLVITPQSKYLDDAQAWIERLDRAEGGQGSSMFVYYVQNGKAETMAEVLTQLFEGKAKPKTEGESGNGNGSMDTNAPPPLTPAEGEAPAAEPAPAEPVLIGPGGEGTSLAVGEVSIIADEENNALLIMATATDYDKVLKAIQKIDILPLQVLVEATIVEVTLEDELRYGLQWFFKNSIGGMRGLAVLGAGRPLVGPTDLTPTGSYTVIEDGEARVLLDLLARDSKLNVVSSPTLMVLDNRTASIRVGDQVPIRTSETTNTSGVVAEPEDPSALVTSTIQYRDTGVLLEVTPRVNAGGMITLEITQEVNDVSDTQTSGIDSPTINQRRIATNVAIQSGETLVLGGLIKEDEGRASEGLPYLRHIPVLGWLFGSQGKSKSRTELVVMLTPTAVTKLDEAREVTREYRNKLKDVTLPQDVWLDRGRQL